MNKSLMTLALLSSIGSAYAASEAEERAKDHAQPTPAPNVVAERTTQTTKIISTGANSAPLVSETTTISVEQSNSDAVSVIESTDVMLPPSKIIDNQMNLTQTLNTMQEAFTQLQSAATVSAMRAPAGVMSDYASQAQALIEADDSSMDRLEDIQDIRLLLIELQQALKVDDLAAAQTKVEIISQAQSGFYALFE